MGRRHTVQSMPLRLPSRPERSKAAGSMVAATKASIAPPVMPVTAAATLCLTTLAASFSRLLGVISPPRKATAAAATQMVDQASRTLQGCAPFSRSRLAEANAWGTARVENRRKVLLSGLRARPQRHREKIYCGKRQGRLSTPGGLGQFATVAARTKEMCTYSMYVHRCTYQGQIKAPM